MGNLKPQNDMKLEEKVEEQIIRTLFKANQKKINTTDSEAKTRENEFLELSDQGNGEGEKRPNDDKKKE